MCVRVLTLAYVHKWVHMGSQSHQHLIGLEAAVRVTRRESPRPLGSALFVTKLGIGAG